MPSKALFVELCGRSVIDMQLSGLERLLTVRVQIFGRQRLLSAV